VTGLALLAGIGATAGLLLAVSGLRWQPVRPRGPRRTGRVPVPTPERVVLVAASAFAVLLFTRWPVAAVAIGVAVAFASSPSRYRRVDEADKAEALTVWVEMLRDATGTPHGIEGVLVATAAGAPALIRPHVVRLARRLPYEPLDGALEGLADDLDHPLGDLVATALRLAARSGGRQIRSVLDDLAAVAREEARMHRRITVARARPRSDMRIVLAIMAFAVGFFVILARQYLEPFGTPLGQLVLCLVGACWATGIWAMGRLGRLYPVERFLVREARP
jgi:Flp pilus assembly protein TadB